jgi:hypothetical protein
MKFFFGRFVRSSGADNFGPQFALTVETLSVASILPFADGYRTMIS